MSRVVLLFGFLFWFGSLFSQNLTGEWKGSFTDEILMFASSAPSIKLYFSKINDSTYRAFSVSYSDDKKNKDSAICILQGGFLKKNTLYLEEIKVIRPFRGGDTAKTCLQHMILTFNKRKRYLELNGNWNTPDGYCGYGTISLIKKL